MRTTLGTATREVRYRASGQHRDRTKRVARALDVSQLPRRPRHTGEVWAIAMVRNELDIVDQVLDHLLSQGVDHVLVADNRSTDGTSERLLQRQSAQVHVVRDDEIGYYQAEKMTRLARAANRSGADWIIPFDADEFWFAEGASLATWLRRSDLDVVEAVMHNVFPTTVGTVMDRARPIHGKVAFRAHALARLSQGNHSVDRPGRRDPGRHLYLAHLPWRSYEQFISKVDQGAKALAAVTMEDRLGDHWRRLGRDDENALRARWESLLRGETDPEMHWTPRGELVPVDITHWSTWDPAGTVGQ